MEVRGSTKEDASDGTEALVGYEGSASVERLMQNYYTSLMADVDQAARAHAMAQASGAGNGEEPLCHQEGPLDVPVVGNSFAAYYFDPFSPDQTHFEEPRRSQQGSMGRGFPACGTATASNGAPPGDTSSQVSASLVSRSHPMLSAAAEKVKGVAFCKSNRYWICTRMEHGKQQCRSVRNPPKA